MRASRRRPSRTISTSMRATVSIRASTPS
jgi:hypothetical protein